MIFTSQQLTCLSLNFRSCSHFVAHNYSEHPDSPAEFMNILSIAVDGGVPVTSGCSLSYVWLGVCIKSIRAIALCSERGRNSSRFVQSAMRKLWAHARARMLKTQDNKYTFSYTRRIFV